MTELYEKAVEGQWYDSRTRRTVQVFAITYEVTQRPSRQETLIMEILDDFPDAGNFEYSDDMKLGYERGGCLLICKYGRLHKQMGDHHPSSL